MRNLLFFEVPFYGNYIFNNHFYIRLSIFYSFVIIKIKSRLL